jgi:hypothetical protein
VHYNLRCVWPIRFALLATLALGAADPIGCGDESSPHGGPPSLSAPLEVVPFAAPLEDVRVQAANDSLDLTRHDGLTFLAFRTSQSYYPDERSDIHVVSAEGEVRWEHELTIDSDDDLREPRFLAWDGRLFLFYGRFGVDSATPEPLGAMVSERVPDEGWTEPRPVLDPGFVVSRLHVVDGLPTMTAWGPSGDDLAVHFLTSDDGLSWRAVRAEGPAVEVGGGSETDVLFLDDGSLFAITVNARGDELGWGSRICRAARIDAAWSCTGDPRRFDGAALFAQGDRTFLVARRNVTPTGAYDLGRDDLPEAQRTQIYVESYEQEPKRCALWQIGVGDVPALVADLPSRGDTCAPSLLRREARQLAVYYQSPPLDGPDVTLRVGQAGASKIHRVLISF